MPISEVEEVQKKRTRTRPERMQALATLPVFFKLAGKRAVVVGGSEPALWKAELLAATGAIVEGDIQAMTERVMKNLEAVLAADGLGFKHVVRTTIFLADMNDFAKVNEVYGRYFTEAPPARATIQAAALPKGARVEIDCIAVA